jgi:pimeloyl-ACP methyl ester carboxylesterase
MTLTPIWRESLLGLEFTSLVRQRIFREPPQAPESLPVMLLPGFLTGDAQIEMLASWLRRCGHRTHRSGIRLNVDCGEAAMCRVEDRLEAFVKSEGAPAVLIGQSRGGTFARVLAVRRPELVRSVVTLGSPHLAPLAVHPLVLLQGASLAVLSSLGVPGLFSRHCRAGECCAAFRDDLAAPMPRGTEFVSIYSKRDGIVDWRACLDPHAKHVDVRSTHCGMGVNAGVYAALDRVLHRPAPRGRKPRPVRRDLPAAA